MSDAISVVATIATTPQHRPAIEHALRVAVAATLGEPGCEHYALHRDPRDADCFVMIERWSNQASIDRHSKGVAFTALAAALKDKATLQVAIYIPID